jgi:hypothetical protein
MRFIAVKGASHASWAVGYLLGSLHLAFAFVIALAAVTGSHDAQWQLVWAPLVIADLPVSLFLDPPAFSLANTYFTGWGSWSDPQILAPLFVHGLFGSLLYTFIPPSISAARQWRSSRHARSGQDPT